MTKLYLLMFVWGPAFLGFSLGWLVQHPDDWSGPAVLGPIGAILTAFTYRWGVRRLPKVDPALRPFFIAGMLAGALVGVLIFGMLALGVLH